MECPVIMPLRRRLRIRVVNCRVLAASVTHCQSRTAWATLQRLHKFLEEHGTRIATPQAGQTSIGSRLRFEGNAERVLEFTSGDRIGDAEARFWLETRAYKSFKRKT
jgi:hypothetical protein